MPIGEEGWILSKQNKSIIETGRYLGRVCINPGHGPLNSGRYDPGAIGPSGLREAAVNTAVAELVNENLSKCGWNTIVVHDGDLADVVRQCNSFRADYFISIHCNAFRDPAANGIETYAYKPGGKGQLIASSIQTEVVRSSGLRNRGVKFAAFYVLRYTLCPAVLVEIGFISNPTEEGLMIQPNLKAKVAQAISRGFHRAVAGTDLNDSGTNVK